MMGLVMMGVYWRDDRSMMDHLVWRKTGLEVEEEVLEEKRRKE